MVKEKTAFAWQKLKEGVDMNGVPVKPSYLKVLHYYPETRLLEVQLSGGVYQYSQVSEAVYAQLVIAQCQSSYFDDHIRYHYKHRRLLTV